MGIINIVRSTQKSNSGTPAVSFAKNLRITPFSDTVVNQYVAFGSATQGANDNEVLLFFRLGISEGGTYAHLYRGRAACVRYNELTDTFGAVTVIDSEADRDLSDIYGCRMDNGEYVYFNSLSPVAIRYLGEPGYPPYPPGNGVYFLRKAPDADLVWGPRRNLLTDPGAVSPPSEVGYLSGSTFGDPAKGGAPGEYYIGFMQFDYTLPDRRISCIKTTDYWETWEFFTIMETVQPRSETAVFYAGAGRVFSLTRNDVGGKLVYSRSADSGVTWTPVGDSSLGWYGAHEKIPKGFWRNGLFNAIWHDRDNYRTMISRNNDPDDFFLTGQFNPPEIYWYTNNGSGGGNFSLGYPCPHILPDNKMFIVISQENNTLDADLFYTMDDFAPDMRVPIAPASLDVLEEYTTDTTAIVNLLGYTEEQYKHPYKYWEFDVSTDPGFTSYVTAKYENPAYPAEVLHNTRLLDNRLYLSALAALSTYYVRVRAVTDYGVSAWATTSFTTAVSASGPFYAALKEGVAYDNELYNGFVMADQYTDGSLLRVHKTAAGHADAGAVPLGRSLNGGASWVNTNITVTGYGEITSAANGFMIFKTGAHAGRILFAWQDDTYTFIRFAYRDGLTGDFAYAGQINTPAGWNISFNSVKMKLTSEGKVRLGYYLFPVPASGNTAKIGWIESTTDGASWVYQAPFYTLADISEFDWCITHDTGVDATCKVILGARLWLPSDGATYYVFLKSTDGGTTFTYDSTSDAGSFVDDHGDTIAGPFERGRLYSFLTSNGPVNIVKHNGEIIIACSERASGTGWVDYNLKLIKASPDDAFENKFTNWTRPIYVRGYNAEHIGASIHCGYADLFQYREVAAGPLKLGWMDYDVSAYTRNPAITTHRCHIYMGSLDDWLYFPAGPARTDIVTGPSFFSGYTSDFNVDHAYDGDSGEYIQLAAGSYTNLQWRGKAKGVKIVGPEVGVATITEYIAFGDFAEAPVIMSHPNNPLREDSVVFNDAPKNYFTIYSRATGTNLIKAVSIVSGRLGIQVETRLSIYPNLAAFPVPGANDHNYRAEDTGIEYHWDVVDLVYVVNDFPIAQQVQTCKMLNCKIGGTTFEGVYNGADATSPIPTNNYLRNVHTLVTGRDGAQTRNGYCEWHDVHIEDAGGGVEGHGVQGHGATSGANSMGGIYRRVFVDSGDSNGMFCNALGVQTFELCRFKGITERGAYINNYTSTTENPFGMTQQVFNFANVKFEGTLGALQILRDPVKLPVTVNRTSTCIYIGAVSIETANGIVDNVIT